MRCLALDVGDRRNGIAVGEVIARPLLTQKRRSKAQDFAAIADLIRAHQVDTVVIGLPFNMDGSTGLQAKRVMRYGERLKEALEQMNLDIELVFWDERLTTEQAEQAMISSGRSLRDRQSRVDAVAAAMILQSYLDHGRDMPARNRDTGEQA